MKRWKEPNPLSHARLLAEASNTYAHKDSPWPPAGQITAFRRGLLAWFRRHGRHLPWRQTDDPYAIWVSEIMLQQTQVTTVIPYYERFLARFPTAGDLAAADEESVLRLWEGLGYYRRARQLHAAARRIVTENGGRFPKEYHAARHLPGIGRYTAGAILSFAFDMRLPVLEANTVRLWARLLSFEGDPLSATGQTLLWSAAQSVLPRRGSGQVNQALMELGSQLCLPREPRCDRCPVRAFCKAEAGGMQQVIPTAKKKAKVESVREAAVVVKNRNRVFLVQYMTGARWAGLWDFPRFAMDHTSDSVQDQLTRALVAQCRMSCEIGPQMLTLRHGVTRFRITLDVFEARLSKGKEQTNSLNGSSIGILPSGLNARRFAQQRWVGINQLRDYPLNTTGRKIAELLEST